MRGKRLVSQARWASRQVGRLDGWSLAKTPITNACSAILKRSPPHTSSRHYCPKTVIAFRRQALSLQAKSFHRQAKFIYRSLYRPSLTSRLFHLVSIWFKGLCFPYHIRTFLYPITLDMSSAVVVFTSYQQPPSVLFLNSLKSTHCRLVGCLFFPPNLYSLFRFCCVRYFRLFLYLSGCFANTSLTSNLSKRKILITTFVYLNYFSSSNTT